RLRPDNAVDRSLARARPLARVRCWPQRRGARAQRRVRGRRSDRQRMARRQGAVARHPRAADPHALGIRAVQLTQRKRDGQELAAGELRDLVLGYARGDVPDYQMAAFCMAVYFRGLSSAETFALTDAMIASGDTIELGAALGRKTVDKHSTGGVGDKTS